MAATRERFAAASSQNHTVARAHRSAPLQRHRQTYSDEILHPLRLPPLALTRSLDATIDASSTPRSRARRVDGAASREAAWPAKVTAPSGDGRARPLWPAPPRLRRARQHRPRRQRDEPLRAARREARSSPIGRCAPAQAGRSTSTSCSDPALFEQAAPSRRSARGRRTLGQQVGGRLVASLLDQRKMLRAVRATASALDQILHLARLRRVPGTS
jgi:hypothetical protein